jgi:hypothetical protein
MALTVRCDSRWPTENFAQTAQAETPREVRRGSAAPRGDQSAFGPPNRQIISIFATFAPLQRQNDRKRKTRREPVEEWKKVVERPASVRTAVLQGDRIARLNSNGTNNLRRLDRVASRGTSPNLVEICTVRRVTSVAIDRARWRLPEVVLQAAATRGLGSLGRVRQTARSGRWPRADRAEGTRCGRRSESGSHFRRRGVTRGRLRARSDDVLGGAGPLC